MSLNRYARRRDANEPEVVRTLRAYGCKVKALNDSDLLVFRPATGALRLLEVKDGAKSPSRRRLTKRELRFAADFPVVLVLCPEDALAAMGFTSPRAIVRGNASQANGNGAPLNTNGKNGASHG